MGDKESCPWSLDSACELRAEHRYVIRYCHTNGALIILFNLHHTGIGDLNPHSKGLLPRVKGVVVCCCDAWPIKVK
jgi:hypothetical protein